MTLLQYIVALFVVYQLKHFIVDYLLQTPYMLGKFKPGWDFVLPLTAHALMHGSFTFAIAGCVSHHIGVSFCLAIFDFVVHFTMDRIKASPRLLGRFKPVTADDYRMCKALLADPPTGETGPVFVYRAVQQLRSNTLFWYSLGIDQMVHHLTHYAIIWILITGAP